MGERAPGAVAGALSNEPSRAIRADAGDKGIVRTVFDGCQDRIWRSKYPGQAACGRFTAMHGIELRLTVTHVDLPLSVSA